MGLLSASAAVTRYKVEGRLENPVLEIIADGLRKNTLAEIDDDVSEKAAGWTSYQNPFKPDFEGSSFAVGEYLIFSLRIDKKQIPTKVVKKLYLAETAKRLEETGLIRGYVALLDARKLERPTTVFVEITLSGQADELLEAFEREVRKIPDVLECHLMAGSADYLLKVVAQDTDDFARIHRQHLARLPGVAQMHSSFALRTVFRTTAIPV